MRNLESITDAASGLEPGDLLINNQTENREIHPDFAFLKTEKAAIIAVISRSTGVKSVFIGPFYEEGGRYVERR